MSEEKEYHYECKKCGFLYKIQGTKEQVDKWLNQPFFSCKGFHMEITSPVNYLEFVKTVEITERPKTAKEILDELMKKYNDDNKENWYHLGDLKKAKELGIESLHSVKDLEHIGFGSFAGGGFRYKRIIDTNEGRLYHKTKG